MNKNMQYIITSLIGLCFLIVGFFSERFIVIRPNRIIDGTVMRMTAVLKDQLGLIAAFFLIFGILCIIGGMKKLPWFAYTGIIFIITVQTLWVTGVVSETMTEGMSSAARTSLGIGFWAFLLGLLIIMQSSIHFDGKEKTYRGLLTFTLLGIAVYVIYYYHLYDHIGIVKEIQSRSSQFVRAFSEHIILAMSAAATGLLISLIMSYKAYRAPQTKTVITSFCNMAQVIPTLSMLGLLMIPLTMLSQKFEILGQLGIKGIGFFPAFIVLTSYTLLPIVNSTVSGFESIQPDILTSAYAMGMTSSQVMYRVELPLALPAILTGFKVALVQSIGNAILAGLVGGGGLGALLFLGLAQSAPDLVIATALIIMLIALFLNSVLAWSIHVLQTKRGRI